ncbi:unnamed protein product [Gongylonema pulchrum]|uniref:Epimerase domain-containing protein n=1 Tax=Gongylonema pulchrum TaxID=637853 RepID=A0A183DU18_9BILA|nr:unnamed protein product [Gongylonema pulchrum]
MGKSAYFVGVLVTGASGYIGIHCVQQLLDLGYTVRGTVRDLSSKVKIEPLKKLHGAKDHLELVVADLEKDDGWPQALTDCTYVLHVASPFPIVADDSIISTAVDGTLRVLRAAAKTSVKKVVLTSSCAAINEGHADTSKVFNEDDWTDVSSNSVLTYSKSKTLAEKAAWEFVKQEGTNFKLTTINPTLVVGPLLHNVRGTSINVSFEKFAIFPTLLAFFQFLFARFALCSSCIKRILSRGCLCTCV